MKWNQTPRGTKVELKVGQLLPSFNGQPRFIPSGHYFITGFWANVCGLNRTSARGENELVIESRALVAFTGITA